MTVELRSRVKPRRQRYSTVLTIAMIAIFAYALLPLVWLVINSTKNTGDLFNSFGLAFGAHFNLFQNLQRLFEYNGGIVWRWLANTVLYAGGAAVLAAIVAALGGYGLAKFDFRGKRVIVAVVLGAVMIPGTALAVPTYLLFSQVGLVDTPWAVILPSAVSPFGLFLLNVYAQEAVPDSLIEAARMDGASEVRIFFSIVLRILGPGIVTVLLFQLVATWNNYFLPLIVLNSPENFPITVGLNMLNGLANSGGAGAGQQLFPLVITGALVSIVPLIVSFLVLQRYWQSGLTTGGVK